jgi:rod shape-determining protein MreB and related proteins
VSAEQVRKAFQRPLRQIVDGVKEVLERTPPELSGDVSARGLTLAGGGALLSGFDRLLEQETGLEVTVAHEPLMTVARGAGQALEELEAISRRR